MYDIIWTIIGIWFLWRIIEAFRAIPSHGKAKAYSRSNPEQQASNSTYQANSEPSQQHKKGELKDDAGEYIDFEEVK